MHFGGLSDFAPTSATTELDFDSCVTTHWLPTSGQISYINNLRVVWQEAEDEIARLTGRKARRPAWVDPASHEEASAMIDRGKDARNAIRTELRETRRSVRVASRTEVVESMWIVGES